MSEDELNAVLDGLDEEFRSLPPSPYRDYLGRWYTRKGRKEGRQEGEFQALMAIAARFLSSDERERLGTLTLERLREEVESRIAQLAGQQRQG